MVITSNYNSEHRAMCRLQDYILNRLMEIDSKTKSECFRLIAEIDIAEQVREMREFDHAIHSNI